MKNKLRYIFGVLAIVSGIGQLNNIIPALLIILFGISLFPIIYEKYLDRFNIKKLHIVLPIILFILFGMAIPKDTIELENNSNVNTTVSKKENTTKKTTKKTTSKKSNEKKDYKSLKNIEDSTLKKNFINACEQIKMDVTKIKNLKKKDDWNSGPRYTFNYEGESFILYAYDSGEISSITIANNNLDKIYLEDYEPYDVNDYILDVSKISDLQITAEESIKSILNYPDTAKFKWMSTGGYSKNNNIYIVSGKFEAKNALGAKIESSFYVEEESINNRYKVVYMVIDNEKYIGTDSKIVKTERKQIITSNTKNSKNDEIIIKDGQLGEYGRYDLFDGEQYIRYYIPEGTYEVEALTKNAQFFIETIELHKESGWDTATTIRKVQLPWYGYTDTFEIKSDQCISLVMHTQIKIKRKS